MKKIVRKIMFAICLALFVYSAFNIYGILAEYKEGNDAYNEVGKNVEVVTNSTEEFEPIVIEPSTEEEVVIYEEKEIFSLDIDWSNLKEPVIGWINIQNEEKINYPIVQSEDNNYYLNHLYDGTYNKNGSIFVDYRNDGLENRHVIIYGHNMRSGAMFAPIKNYLNQEYADEHRYIYIGTPNGETRVFYVYAAQKTDALGDEDGFSAYQISFDGEEWQEWIAKTQEKSAISAGIELPEKCNIITLSTCAGGVKTQRVVVHAVEVANKELIPINETK